MKKLNFRPSFLRVLYLVIYFILFALIIFVPKLITGPLHITGKLIFAEEITEGTLLGILFVLNILILNLYKKETSKQKEQINRITVAKKTIEERLEDSFRYIGQLNVQIQEIKSIFTSSHKFPETKSDFRKTLLFFIGRVLGITDTDWVLFRIIDRNTPKTLYEQYETRKGLSPDYPHISNKTIIEKQSCPPYSAVISNPQNMNILTCCIVANDRITNEERLFIQAITNEITMLYVIMNSTYYRKNNNVSVEDYSESKISNPIAKTWQL